MKNEVKFITEAKFITIVKEYLIERLRTITECGLTDGEAEIIMYLLKKDIE